jgi:CRISPR system Cascade subunit CasA
MRLFLCVAHAALDGPKDYDDWQKVPKRLPEAAGGYLYTWKDSFELFHPTKPWLQIADLESGKIDGDGWGAVSKLRFFMASGANTTLYDHEGMDNNERSMGLSETILSMISFQCFSPGGLISQVFWQGMQTSKSSKDGPCVPASMVHVLLRRENMLQTLHSNLPTYEEVRLSYAPHPIGRPPWEKMPTSLADADAVGNSTASYLGRLVPLTRLIRLHENGSRMLMGEGFACPAFTDGFPAEPTAIVVVRIKDKVPVRALLSYRPGRALWRELGAIAVKRSAKSAGETGGPLSLKSLGQGESCDLVVCALARDQATILDTTESVFHIPLANALGRGP